VDEAATEKFMHMRRVDQQRALGMLRTDATLKCLHSVEAPLLDLEVRGVPALKYFGDQVWTGDEHVPHDEADVGASIQHDAEA
jgi:hypothetical protein